MLAKHTKLKQVPDAMEHTEDVVVVSTTIPHASTIVSDASPEKAEAVLKIPTASGSSATTTPMATVSTTPVVEKHFQRRIFKIIVIGDSNVGKTCLTYRFCSGKFPTKVEATIGVDFREKIVEVDGETIKVITQYIIDCTNVAIFYAKPKVKVLPKYS